MSTALHLARPEDIDRLLPLVEAFHSEAGIVLSSEDRHAAVLPLLEGTPLGVAYLIGPTRAPVGYIVITFGWSIEFGGMDAFIDELYIRPAVRKRGMGTDVLTALPRALADAGVKAFHLEVDHDNETAQRLYTRAGFTTRPRYMLMSRKL
ncbi:Acetyltransferase (GNAT) family protein [Shimia gijangensis]|uniref:Acetyltransferase (GNAT) family protein n=1 Tax=Shimia gijangensis TaxID=1470563 RepID=A0A1M6HGI9_9RHOB|nr:N-acetyltransferase [Shimia gijangensis]SHJ21285.1 Acetyltransferase (GNAT) family protein [Shimia gijangensis]